MILKRDILPLLEDIDSAFGGADPQFSALYSKMAIIELCGWLEQSFDSIASRCVKNRIATPVYRDVFNSIVSKNYGFHYTKNYRRMMLQTIGVLQMEQLELQLTATGEKNILESTLEILGVERNRAAHTTTAGAMPTYQAPSTTISQFKNLFPIVRKMYSFAVNEV